MNTNDTELLRLFDTLTTEQKIDIARHLLQNKDIKSTTVITKEEDKAISFSQPYVLLSHLIFVFFLIWTYLRMNSVY